MTDQYTNDRPEQEEDAASADVREVRAWAHLRMSTIDAAVAPAMLIAPKYPNFQAD